MTKLQTIRDGNRQRSACQTPTVLVALTERTLLMVFQNRKHYQKKKQKITSIRYGITWFLNPEPNAWNCSPILLESIQPEYGRRFFDYVSNVTHFIVKSKIVFVVYCLRVSF